MKASTQELNSVQRKVVVHVPKDAVVNAFNEIYAKIQKKANIKGFRPGKAPISIIKQYYANVANYEVSELLIQKHLQTALKSQNLSPVGTPVIDKIGTVHPETEFTFEAIIDVMPSFQMPEVSGISVNCKEFAFNEDTVEKEMNGLRQRQAKSKSLPSGSTAASGNLAILSHTAESDGYDLADLRAENISVVLGRGELLGDIESMIYGMQAGEMKEGPINLPPDYGDADLAGKTIHFRVRLEQLYDLVIPELNEEFAKDLEFGTLEELKDQIRSGLERETARRNKNEAERAILDEILRLAPFEVPPSIVDQITDNLISEIFPAKNKEWQDAIKNEDVRTRLRPEAKRRAQNTLMLLKVVEMEKIQVSDDEIRSELEKFKEEQKPAQDPEKFYESMKPYLHEQILFDKAMKSLLNKISLNKIPNLM